MAQFSKKLVAVLNEKTETGKSLNALAHMAIGLGAGIQNKEELRLMDYIDADGGKHPNISEIPFIILFTDFTNTMTVGTYKEQIEN